MFPVGDGQMLDLGRSDVRKVDIRFWGILRDGGRVGRISVRRPDRWLSLLFFQGYRGVAEIRKAGYASVCPIRALFTFSAVS